MILPRSYRPFLSPLTYSIAATCEPKPGHTDDMVAMVDDLRRYGAVQRVPCGMVVHGHIIVHPALREKLEAALR